MSNSAFITDDTNVVNISVILPTKGDYKLDVFGKETNVRESSYPYLFSLIIKNLGKGSNKKFATAYSPFYDNTGTVIISPTFAPLEYWKNDKSEVFFDFILPGAIDAAINPGWHFLSKPSEEEDRWQESVRVQSGNLRLDVKYDDGNSFRTLLEWVNNDV